MNKLYMFLMAALCLLTIACSPVDADYDQEVMTLDSRSSVLFTVSYVSTDNSNSTFMTDEVSVNYHSDETFSISYVATNGSDKSVQATSVTVMANASHALLVHATPNGSFATEDISIDICNSNLCYSNLAGTLSGQALDFIIEDDPHGI